MATKNDWTGKVGDVWAEEWRRTDLSFADLSRQLNAAILAVAPAGPGVAVDIGCGAGSTSIALAAARPDLSVTGVDLSRSLAAIARDRAARSPNLTIVNDDIRHTSAALAPIDMYVSRHGVMFFADPVSAFAGLHAAAAPGARIVFSCFRAADGNTWTHEINHAVTGELPALRGTEPGPFAFADPDYVTDLLGRAGWGDIARTPVDYAHRTGEGTDPVAETLHYFQRIGTAAALLREMPRPDRNAALDRIAAVARRHQHGDTIDFPAQAWIWSARAS